MCYFTMIQLKGSHVLNDALWRQSTLLRILYLQSIYIRIIYKLKLSLIVQSGIKTAHHIVC